jgi:hypothetical protein
MIQPDLETEQKLYVYAMLFAYSRGKCLKQTFKKDKI